MLLTTFSDTLAAALQTKLRRLIGNSPRLAERMDVCSLNSLGLRLYKSQIGKAAAIVERDALLELLAEASKAVGGHKFSLHFIYTEWDQVVDAWQLETWDSYRDVARLGRKTRLPETQRSVLWSIFDRVRVALQEKRLMAVEMIIDQWNPSQKKYRFETFCYGPNSCSLYRPGPTRKVPGRKGMSWEEEDWVDADATAHRDEDE